MAQTPSQPILLLAFANEQGQPGQYLRDLPEEVRRLQATLEQAQAGGLCQVLVRANATLDDILKVFLNPVYRDRIAIFHYSGHANSADLLLEGANRQTQAADAAGLAAFLGQQRGLQLVFLNGCSTQAQVEALQQAGVPVVIATASAIRDDLAREFAGLFYQSLAARASLKRAYLEAESALKTRHGSGTPRGLYVAGAEATERWPWSLSEGAAGAAEWRLPEASEVEPGQAAGPEIEIGGVSLAGISGGHLTTGPISSQASAGRDIVGRDQVTHYHLYGDSAGLPEAKGADPEEAAKTLLAQMPLDKVPEPAPLPPGSRLPFPPNPLFVGREVELKRLARCLKAGQNAAIGPLAAATGLGGIGKSQLATEFAHRYGQYFAGGVFWLSLAEAESVPAQVALCGGAGGLALRPDFESLPLEAQVEAVLAVWQAGVPRLLIFDNCEEEALLIRWRPATGGCRVLVTSRRHGWSKGLAVQRLPLGVLDRAESVALLQSHLGYPETAETSTPLPGEASSKTHHSSFIVHHSLEALAEELGDLPLALHLAGSYLESYRDDPELGDPAQFLADLRADSPLAHPALSGEEPGYSPTQHDLSVWRTFNLSLAHLDPTGPVDGLARSLLARAAYFAPGQAIPRQLLLATLSLPENDRTAARQAAQALRRLTGLGLLAGEAEEGLSLHRLLARFIQAGSPGEGATLPAFNPEALAEAQIAVETTLFTEAARLNRAGDPRPLLAWQSHLRAVTEAALAREDEQAANLRNSLGYYLHMIGDYGGARPYFEQALAISEKVLGPEHPDTATSSNNLGSLLQDMGDYGAARPYYERALAIRERVLGPEHPHTALSLNNLGALLQAMGDYAGALPYYERALAIRERVLGPEHPDTATSLNNLGTLLRAMGDNAGVRPYYERALAIRERVLGPEHPDTALSLNNVGALLYNQDQFQAAATYFERAFIIREKVLGPDHPDTATSLWWLGMIQWKAGDLAGAQAHLQRTVESFTRSLGPEHPNTQNCRSMLATLEGEVGRRMKDE